MFLSKNKPKKSADLRLFKNMSFPEKALMLLAVPFIIYSFMVLVWWICG